jgi:Kdo2-lipid IVA lauroyltransferase/acyltransferase
MSSDDTPAKPLAAAKPRRSPAEKRSSKDYIHPLRARLEVAAYLAGNASLRALPHQAGYALAEKIGGRVFDAGGKRARWALANVKIAFPDLPPAEQHRIARESYIHFGKNMVDLARAEKWSNAEIVERCPVDHDYHVDRALERGRGALLLTLHIGNWELGVQSLGIGIARYRPVVIGRPMRNRMLYDRIAASRQSSGVELLSRENALLGLARRLRNNRPVALLNDQYARRSRGVFAPFLGVRASSPAGLATLALRTGAAIVPCYTYRIGLGRYQGYYLPEVELAPSTGDRKQDLVDATARCNAVLERLVREHPDQWLWGHRRFRHSPDIDHDPYASDA